jgi:hypothetical protein
MNGEISSDDSPTYLLDKNPDIIGWIERGEKISSSKYPGYYQIKNVNLDGRAIYFGIATKSVNAEYPNAKGLELLSVKQWSQIVVEDRVSLLI